jgi:hypothetical protein
MQGLVIKGSKKRGFLHLQMELQSGDLVEVK